MYLEKPNPVPMSSKTFQKKDVMREEGVRRSTGESERSKFMGFPSPSCPGAVLGKLLADVSLAAFHLCSTLYRINTLKTPKYTKLAALCIYTVRTQAWTGTTRRRAGKYLLSTTLSARPS